MFNIAFACACVLSLKNIHNFSIFDFFDQVETKVGNPTLNPLIDSMSQSLGVFPAGEQNYVNPQWGEGADSSTAFRN